MKYLKLFIIFCVLNFSTTFYAVGETCTNAKRFHTIITVENINTPNPIVTNERVLSQSLDSILPILWQNNDDNFLMGVFNNPVDENTFIRLRQMDTTSDASGDAALLTRSVASIDFEFRPMSYVPWENSHLPHDFFIKITKFEDYVCNETSPIEDLTDISELEEKARNSALYFLRAIQGILNKK